MNKRQRKKAKRKEILKRTIILDSLPTFPEMRNHKKIRHKRETKQLIRLVENFHHMMSYGKLWSIAQEKNAIITISDIRTIPMTKSPH